MSRTNIPVRYDKGLNNLRNTDLLAKLPVPFSPRKLTEYFDDFQSYVSGGYGNGGTGGTVGLGNALGGIINLSTPATIGDTSYLLKNGETFQFVDGYQLWYRTVFQVGDMTNSEVMNGLVITNTAPFGVTDGVYFYKAAGSTALQLVQVSSATGKTTTTDLGVALANAVNYDCAFYFDGGHYDAVGDAAETYNLRYEIRDDTGAVIASGSVAANLPTALLTCEAAVQASTAATQELSLDYFYVAQEVAGRE